MPDSQASGGLAAAQSLAPPQQQSSSSAANETATSDAATNQRSPLTTPSVSHYGTMEFNDISSQNNATSQQAATQAETPISAPKPAVRRKIQRAGGAETEMGRPASSENNSSMMSTIDDTIQAIDQQSSSLTSKRATAAVAAATTSEAESASGGAPSEKLSTLALTLRPTGEDEQHQQQQQQQQQEKSLGPTRPYPKKVLFIIANEFCERFSYYGLRTVLVLYFRSVLGFSDSGSTVSFHLFATLCYLTPILGAILGDSILGKYKTILYLSIVYFLGEFILVLSSIFWDLNTMSVLITWFGLLLIGIGTGGIKPCVAAFAGDQFLANETKWRENFFSLFYGAINLGSLISMFLTPLLRSNYGCVGRNDCYPYAFGLPCLLIFLATAVFLLAHNHYYISPLPKENVIVAFCQCTWLALKRKWSGRKLAGRKFGATTLAAGHINHSLAEDEHTDQSGSPSRSSISSSENEAKPVAPKHKNPSTVAATAATAAAAKATSISHYLDEQQLEQQLEHSFREPVDEKRAHWLYLAADRFDKNSIEEFRSVLGILLLFLPTPVYWCLFDQQGSLWTLQATRMDGRIPGTNFILEPDQMMVANPLLLLTAIPIFQLAIYPALNRCNLITTPIQRMTTGGLIAALSFVASAVIEFQVQASQPHLLPMQGRANLLLVNGLSDCSLANASIHLEQGQSFAAAMAATAAAAAAATTANNQTGPSATIAAEWELLQAVNTIDSLGPLSTRRLYGLPTSTASYKLQFKLTDSEHQHATHPQVRQSLANATSSAANTAQVGCPFDPKQARELNIGPLPNQAVRLLYIDQGNGKLTFKLFNESLALPEANKARVRLLYEFFGSFSSAQKRTFSLAPVNSAMVKQQLIGKELKFNMTSRDGQVLLSDYLDIEIAPSGGQFLLQSNDSSLNLHQAQLVSLKFEPGTRNLLLLHQMNATAVKLSQELLQDNNYRISVLYQLIPYTMISMSEVMFSITGLEFSYAMAPPNLKSLILGAWSLTTAFGNILTVAVESARPFANIGHDFLFYAALMAADMILFAILGYHYEPYQPYHSKSKSTS